MNGYTDGGATGPSGAAAGAGAGTVVVPAGPTMQPQLLVRKLDRDEVTFHLSGVEMAFANGLRRTMIADVPTIGEWI
jgi:DNA-directed RNA polymerase II subunit RPB3